MRRSVRSTPLPAGTHLVLECGHPVCSTDIVDAVADCQPCDHRRLPVSLRPGRKTPTFEAGSVPPALLRAHRTNGWAELVVLAGSVEFVDEEPRWQTTATADRRVVIVPQRAHHIIPSADARFYVQFYDLPDVGSGSGSDF